MVFSFFLFCLTLSVSEKFKSSIFQMPISTQILNINNLRTTSAKSINMRTVRKVIEYSLKNVMEKDNVYSSHFRGIAVLDRWVLSPV